MNLQSRVMNILTKPKEEWPVIANETTDVPSLYKEYIVPLAAIPAVCGFIGMTIVGISIPFVGTFRTPIPQWTHQHDCPICSFAGRSLCGGDYYSTSGSNFSIQRRNRSGLEIGSLRVDTRVDCRSPCPYPGPQCLEYSRRALRHLSLLSGLATHHEDPERKGNSLYGCGCRSHPYNQRCDWFRFRLAHLVTASDVIRLNPMILADCPESDGTTRDIGMGWWSRLENGSIFLLRWVKIGSLIDLNCADP